MAYLFALAADEEGRAQLRDYCAAAGVDADALLHELDTASPFDESIVTGRSDGDVFPLSRKLRQHLRGLDLWQSLVVDKLSLGSDAMRDLGNLYSAALPAWLASGLRQAKDDGLDLAGQRWLALGYGSGDAAEALPMRVADGWEEAAGRIDFAEALGDPVDLTEAQYLALHEGRSSDLVPVPPSDEFVVESVGTVDGPDFHNLGIEYYRYVPPRPR
jgi:hydroxymethylglutaryl-CoA synthase